jgi:DNA-binding transcriptional regulator YiaG
MGRATRSNRSGPGPGAKRKQPQALSPRVREMVDDLHAICDAVESGIPLERVATVRTFRVRAEIPAPSPDEIRAIRGSLGLSQAGFAEFLGAGLGTVRSWELGQREPSALARRFLGAIRDDPAYWRGRLATMSRPQEPLRSGRRGG